MKKLMIIYVIMTLPAVSAFCAGGEKSKIFTPYFDMVLTEGVYVPSEGNFFSGGEIDTRVGLLAKASEKDSFFGLYSFAYSGPGFNPQDTEQWQDRSLSHGFNIEYRRNLSDKFRIRPGIAYSTEFRRTGSNEAWENGLYNTDSLGGQLAVDYNFDFEKNGMLTFQALYRNIEFPNYTDLLSEFNNASNTAETSGGLQDQKMKQVSLRPGWNNFFGGITYTLQDYENQKVVESNGAYGNTLQENKTTRFDLGFHHTLWIFEMYPVASYTMYRSNQNYMRYKYLGATSTDLTSGSSDVTFVSKSYDYNEIELSVPVDLLLTKTGKWAINGSMSMTKRDYTDRPPRDANNNYDFSKQQNNLLTVLGGGLRKRLNDVSMFRINYSLIIAESNNKFEQYLPYNYTGNSLGISYQLKY
ncbi:MAG: hypothetical protein HY746_08770 [Elusimicrobia bacterium]|nr:hypothetical protein [Elusimicrobiota bacterium]